MLARIFLICLLVLAVASEESKPEETLDKLQEAKPIKDKATWTFPPFSFPTGTPSYPTGTPSYPTGTPSYPTGTPSYPTYPPFFAKDAKKNKDGKAMWTFPPFSFPTGTPSYPTGTPSYPTGTPSYPTGTPSYPTYSPYWSKPAKDAKKDKDGKAMWTFPPFSFPTGTPSYPTGTPSYPTGTPSYPTGTPSYPTYPPFFAKDAKKDKDGKAMWTFPPFSFPTGTPSYPTGTPSYPTGTPSYPTGTPSYPTYPPFFAKAAKDAKEGKDGKAMWTFPPFSFPTGTPSYPTGTPSYPTGTPSYPTGTPSYPTYAPYWSKPVSMYPAASEEHVETEGDCSLEKAMEILKERFSVESIKHLATECKKQGEKQTGHHRFVILRFSEEQKQHLAGVQNGNDAEESSSSQGSTMQSNVLVLPILCGIVACLVLALFVQSIAMRKLSRQLKQQSLQSLQVEL